MLPLLLSIVTMMMMLMIGGSACVGIRTSVCHCIEGRSFRVWVTCVCVLKRGRPPDRATTINGLLLHNRARICINSVPFHFPISICFPNGLIVSAASNFPHSFPWKFGRFAPPFHRGWLTFRDNKQTLQRLINLWNTFCLWFLLLLLFFSLQTTSGTVRKGRR